MPFFKFDTLHMHSQITVINQEHFLYPLIDRGHSHCLTTVIHVCVEGGGDGPQGRIQGGGGGEENLGDQDPPPPLPPPLFFEDPETS